MAFVYILQSQKNRKYYIGSTLNLDRRFVEHQLGRSTYTKRVLPIKLIFYQKYKKLSEARKIENWLKKQKDRDFIKRIISENFIKKKVG